MKKFIAILFMILLPLNVFAANKVDTVTLSACVDANSARFMYGLKEIKVKFIGVDTTDEITFDNKFFSVSDYTCSLLKKAKKINLEYEPSLKEDQYGRIQAWVLIDGVLLQENLVKNGYIKPVFLEEKYIYFKKLSEAEALAKEKEIGIWEKIEEEKPKEEVKEEKNIFQKILDFIVGLFNKLIDFIDKLIKDIF